MNITVNIQGADPGVNQNQLASAIQSAVSGLGCQVKLSVNTAKIPSGAIDNMQRNMQMAGIKGNNNPFGFDREEE